MVPHEGLTKPLRTDAERLRILLFESHNWVHRRVDALRLGSGGTTRRHVSLDFTLDAENAIVGSKGTVVVPVAVLQKVPLRGFDITCNGKPLSVLGTSDSAPVTLAMLEGTVPEEIGLSLESRKELSALIREAVYFQPLRLAGNGAEGLLQYEDEGQPGHLDPEPSRTWIDGWDAADVVTDRMKEWFAKQTGLVDGQTDVLAKRMATIERFIRSFVLLAEIDEICVSRRTVVKYALDQDFPERRSILWREIPFIQIVPDFGFARSQHIEFEVPAGLVVNSLELVPFDSNNRNAGLVQLSRGEQSRAAHVYAAPEDRFQDAVFLADVAPAAQGLLTFVTGAVAVVLALAVMSVPIRMAEPPIIDTAKLLPSPAASLLLIGPALLLSWMAKEPEHRLSAAVLFPLRAMLILDAVALLLMAGLAAVPTVAWIWSATWWVIYALVALSTVWLILYRWAWIEIAASSIRLADKMRGGWARFSLWTSRVARSVIDFKRVD